MSNYLIENQYGHGNAFSIMNTNGGFEATKEAWIKSDFSTFVLLGNDSYSPELVELAAQNKQPHERSAFRKMFEKQQSAYELVQENKADLFDFVNRLFDALSEDKHLQDLGSSAEPLHTVKINSNEADSRFSSIGGVNPISYNYSDFDLMDRIRKTKGLSEIVIHKKLGNEIRAFASIAVPTDLLDKYKKCVFHVLTDIANAKAELSVDYLNSIGINTGAPEEPSAK